MPEEYANDPRLRRFARDHGLSASAVRDLVALLEGLVEERGRTAGTPGVLDALAVPVEPPVLGERYVDLGRIGAGATGDVRRVHDRAIGRDLAMKVLHRALLPHPGALARFRREASFTARLDHPGVVVVHDQGTLPDGRPWFTMQEVRGATLRVASREWSVHRRIDAFARVCQAIAHAHERGVVHRDLKPDNIMVGRFGEVRVMDWGLAAQAGERTTEEQLPELGVGLTRAGAVLGTPGFQAPEVLAGNAPASTAADVWAVGAILHTLLGYGLPRDPVELDEAPPDLAALCLRALARDPAARPSAAAIAEEALGWLEGAQRRAQADALLARVDARLPEVEALHTAAGSALAEAEAARRAADPTVRRSGWRMEAAAAAQARAGALAEAEVERELHAALNLAPDHAEIEARLADLYKDRLERAEARRDLEAAAASEVLLRAHDRGRHAAWLSGEGRLVLETTPPGAKVTWHPLVEVERRLVDGPGRKLGKTPLDTRIPHGAGVLRVDAPGYAPARIPIVLPRLGEWVSRVPLLPAKAAPHACYVPAGPFACGGDPGAADHLPARQIWVDGFVIGRFPVTTGQWLAFVREVDAQGEPVEELLPCTKRDLRPIFVRGEGGWEVGPDDRGEVWAADIPITQITWFAARRWCAAQPSLFGEPWRLPDEVEWEKAARGVDGRAWPWGHHFEPSEANLAGARGEPRRAAVDTFPDDTSIYGVRGLAGNVRDLCANAWTPDGDIPDGPLVPREAEPTAERVVLRGGSWYSAPAFCRPANRLVGRPDDRISGVGFRPVATFRGVR